MHVATYFSIKSKKILLITPNTINVIHNSIIGTNVMQDVFLHTHTSYSEPVTLQGLSNILLVGVFLKPPPPGQKLKSPLLKVGGSVIFAFRPKGQGSRWLALS